MSPKKTSGKKKSGKKKNATESTPKPPSDNSPGLRDAADGGFSRKAHLVASGPSEVWIMGGPAFDETTDYIAKKTDRSKKPTIDFETFTVRFKGRSCELRNTIEFELFKRLNRRPGVYLPIRTLIVDVWKDRHIDKNTVQRRVSSLRHKLQDAGFDGVEIDGNTNRGHYALKLSGK